MIKKSIYFFLLGVLIFHPIFFSGFLWDDNIFIFKNPAITKTSHPFVFWDRSSYHNRAWPVGYFNFWILFHTFGKTAFAYKLLNLIFHFLNTFLLIKVLKLKKISFYLPVAILFFIHPIHVETLSWIFQLNTILSCTFFLISWYFLELYLLKKDSKSLILSLISFSTSLFTKSYAAGFPLFVFFYVYKTNLSLKKKSLIVLSFSVLSLYAGYQTIIGVKSSKIENKHRNNFHEGKSKKLNSLSRKSQLIELYSSKKIDIEVPADPSSKFFTKYFLISQNFVHYFKHFLFPYKQLLVSKKWKDSVLSISICSFLILLMIYFLTIPGRFSDYKNYLYLCIALFAPYSGFFYVPFMKYSPTSDHWAYLMTIPLSILLMKLFHEKFKLKQTYLYLFIALLSIKTIYHGYLFNYKNYEFLFNQNIKENPTNKFLYLYQVKQLQDQRRFTEAHNVLNKALEIFPNSRLFKHRRKKLLFFEKLYTRKKKEVIIKK